jgi:predicted RNA polymerase sigma factor
MSTRFPRFRLFCGGTRRRPQPLRCLVPDFCALLSAAGILLRPGVHKERGQEEPNARAAHARETDWAQIDALYAALERLQPSPVVTLNRAVAVGKVRGPLAALAMIEPLAPRLSGYFHFFGAKGAFLLQLGRKDEARIAFDQAIALANTPAEAAHIRLHVDRLIRESAPTVR